MRRRNCCAGAAPRGEALLLLTALAVIGVVKRAVVRRVAAGPRPDGVVTGARSRKPGG